MATIIPFVPGDPLQLIAITLDTEPYVMRARWNSDDLAWYLDVWERDGTTPIAFGIKLVLGVRLGSTYLNPLFTAGLFLIDNDNSGVEAGLNDLGRRVVMVHLTAADAIIMEQP